MAKAGFVDKHKALKLEDVKPNTNYAFTINPINKYQMFNSFTRLSDIMKEMHHYLGCLKHYVLYPEISPKGRFHLHGWIWFNDNIEIMQFYIDYLPTLQNKCTYEMDVLTDVKIWTEYCLKQKSFHDYFVLQTYHSVPLKFDFGSIMDNNIKKNKDRA